MFPLSIPISICGGVKVHSKFRKIGALILITLVLASAVAPASAFVAPVIVRAAEIPLKYFVSASIIAHITAALGIHAIRNSGEIANIDEAALVKAPASLVWVDLQNIPDVPTKVPVVNERAVDANLSPNEQRKLSEKEDAAGNKLYPKMYDVHHLVVPPEPTPVKEAGVGAKISTPGGWGQIDSVSNGHDPDIYYIPGSVAWGAGVVVVHGDAKSYCPNCGPDGTGMHNVDWKYFHIIAPPPPEERPATDTEVKNSVGSSSGSPSPVAENYKDEIEKMLRDPDYVPVFTDANTGEIVPPPPGALTDAQTAAANEYVQKQQAAAQAAYAADVLNSQAIQKQIDAATARTAATAAQSASSSDPTNSTLASQAVAANKAASDAEAAAAQATAAAAGAASTSAAAAGQAAAASGSAGASLVGGPGSADGDGEGEETAMPPSGSADSAKSLNFDSMNQVLGVLPSKFPFNLISQGFSYADVFIRSPSAPSFDLTLPYGFVMHLDLAVFDPVAAVCRFFVTVLLLGGSLIYVVRFWRGVA